MRWIQKIGDENKEFFQTNRLVVFARKLVKPFKSYFTLKAKKRNLKYSKWAEIAISSTQSMKSCLIVYPNAWTWPALQKIWYPGQFLQRIGPEFPKNRSNIHQNGPKLYFQAYNHCLVDFSFCFFNYSVEIKGNHIVHMSFSLIFTSNMA